MTSSKHKIDHIDIPRIGFRNFSWFCIFTKCIHKISKEWWNVVGWLIGWGFRNSLKFIFILKARLHSLTTILKNNRDWGRTPGIATRYLKKFINYFYESAFDASKVFLRIGRRPESWNYSYVVTLHENHGFHIHFPSSKREDMHRLDPKISWWSLMEWIQTNGKSEKMGIAGVTNSFPFSSSINLLVWDLLCSQILDKERVSVKLLFAND